MLCRFFCNIRLLWFPGKKSCIIKVKDKELKIHRYWLPGRLLCSIRSNRKWCKRRGSSLECQNCFFVYPIIDSNLTNLSIYNIIIACPQLKSKQFSQFLYLVLDNSSSIFSCIFSISGKIKRIPRLYIANTSLKLIVSSRSNFLCMVIGLFSIVCT